MYNQSNYKGKTFAQVASRINNKYKNRGDSISKDTMLAELSNLAFRNDISKANNMKFKEGGMYQGGGPLDEHQFRLPEPSFDDTNDIQLYQTQDWQRAFNSQFQKSNGDNLIDSLMRNPLDGGFKPKLDTDPVQKIIPTTTPDQSRVFTDGDNLGIASALMKANYYNRQSKRPLSNLKFNTGFDEARQQINQIGISTQAEQNARIRNRNAFSSAVNNQSPNAGIRNANLQNLFATDDLNTQRISQAQREVQNNVRKMLSDIAVRQGADRQDQLLRRDDEKVQRERFRHAGANMALDQVAKVGDKMNYYQGQKDQMEILKTMPYNFDFGSDIFNPQLKFRT